MGFVDAVYSGDRHVFRVVGRRIPFVHRILVELTYLQHGKHEVFLENPNGAAFLVKLIKF
jgi:hypothetical protein